MKRIMLPVAIAALLAGVGVAAHGAAGQQVSLAGEGNWAAAIATVSVPA